VKYSIRITRQALAHLREIRRYIEEELAAPDAALNTIRAIRTEIATATGSSMKRTPLQTKIFTASPPPSASPAETLSPPS
jgi:plasmid stabilization system protein ParE